MAFDLDLPPLPTAATVPPSYPELNAPEAIDQSKTTPSAESVAALAKQDALVLDIDPRALEVEMNSSGGSHSRSAEVAGIARNRVGQRLVDRVEALRLRPKDKPVTREEYEELSALYKSAKDGVNPEYYTALGRVLVGLDKEFATPKARTKAGAKVDRERKAQLESFAEERSRIFNEVTRSYVGDPTKASTKTAYAGEVLLQSVPVLGTADSLALLPALNAAYTEITGRTLPRASAVKMGDVMFALREQFKSIENLPADKQEAELRRAYSILFGKTKSVGITKGSFKAIADVIPGIEEEAQTFNIVGTTFTTDDIDTFGKGLEGVLGMVGGAYLAKQGTKFLKGKLMKAAADNASRGLPAPALGELMTNVQRLRPDVNEGSILAAVQNKSVADVAPNPFRTAGLKGNTGLGMEHFLKALEEKTKVATNHMGSKLFEVYEQDAMIARVKDSLNELGGTLRPEYTEVIARDNTGFRMSGVIGASGESGWSSAMDALYFAMDQLPLAESTILRRDLVTGEFEEISGDALKNTSEWIGKPGEYFVKTDSFYKYNPEDRGLFGDLAPVEMSMGGAVARALFEPASRFSRQMLEFAQGAQNKEFAVKEAANSLLSGNFLKLHGASRAKVQQVLEDGDTLGKEFSYDELVTKYPSLTEKEQKAYFEARAFNKMLYDTANRQMRDTMAADKWKATYRVGLSDAPDYVRMATDNIPDYIYDPRVGRLISRDEANASGLPIVESHSPKDSLGTGKYTHRLLDNDEIVDELPRYVLNYNAGQITRIYDENWFVRVVQPEVINGKTVLSEPKVVAVARTAKEAEQYAAKLQSEAPEGVTYSAGRDEKALRALSVGSYDFDVQGALMTSTRGSRLTRVDGSPARILDPFNAMNVARDVVAGREAWSDYMTGMKALMLKTWPKHFLLDDTGSIIMAQGSKTAGDFEEAEQFFHWIKSMEAGDVDAIMFKQRMVQMSERIQKSDLPAFVADPVAAALNRVPAVDPVKWMRNIAFMTQVALSGPRTILLNGLQPLFLAGIAPIKSIRALAFDQWALHLAMLNRDNPKLDSILAGYLKVTGAGTGDIKFYRAAMEAYRLSGIPYSLDSHAFYRGTDFSPALKSTDGAVAEVVKGMVSAVPRLGSAVFRGGEQMNLASTFMVAARRYKDKNPKADWNDPRVWSDIATDARALSLDMTKVNDLSYQKGWAAIPLQYFAITHKALTFMLTNKTLSKAERFKIMAGATAVYGSAGFPFGPELVDDWLESTGVDLSALAEEEAINLRNAIHGGLMDLTYNMIFTEEDGTSGSVKVAKSTSMTNGIIDMLRQSMGEDATFLKVMTGAVGSVHSTYGRVAGEVAKIYERPDMSQPEKLLEALAVAPEVTSGWSRYAKARLGLQMSATVSSNFKPMVNQTVNENWSKGLFGFESYREAESWMMQQRKEDLDAEMKTDVDNLARQLVRILSKYGEDYDAAHAEMMEYQKVYAVDEYTYWVWQKAVKDVLIPVQTAAVSGGLTKDKYEKLMEQMIKGMVKGNYSDDLSGRIINSDHFLRLPPEEQAKLREVLKSAEDQFKKDTIGEQEESE